METIKEQQEKEVKREEKEEKEAKGNNKAPNSPSSVNPFAFWAYFTIFISLLTLLISSLPSFSLFPPDQKSWFLSLPNDLRLHYSKGKMVKVQTGANRYPAEVFVAEAGPRDAAAETVLLVHGLGCNSYSFRHVLRSLSSNQLRAVAVDLPGSGFSDKMVQVEEAKGNGVWARILDIYDDIKEKGLFWGFDQLIETGQIPYEEKELTVSTRKVFRPLILGAGEMGGVLGQVIDSMGLAPVHLVLHDSAIGSGANWVLENPGLVSSVTLVDSTAKLVAFPTWVLEMPVVREILLGFPILYAGLLRFCCSKSIERSIAEVHRILLRGRDGQRAALGAGKALNYSFDLGEWARSESVGNLPVQMLWSGHWSEAWTEEGRRVANVVPQAKFIMHSGGRWPQEDAADEIAEKIAEFISSLPKSARQIVEEPLPEHIKKMFDEANDGHHHHHHHHHHGHDHAHAAGYMAAYGLGHGWGEG